MTDTDKREPTPPRIKLEKGFKCPRYLKKWGSLDKSELRMLMRANASYARQRREGLKKRNRDKDEVPSTSPS